MKYSNKFIACDVETGGLPKKGKLATIDIALTEIACVSIDNESLTIDSKNSWLIKPYEDGLIYEKKAEEVSGISKKMCEKEGLEIEVVYENLKNILKDNKIGRQKPILLFHNKSFDTPFLDNMFKIFNDDIFKYIDRCEDTMEWSRLKFIEKPNFKLGSVAEFCNLDLVMAHRALPDTIVTAKIWIHFMKCLRNEVNNNEKDSSVVTYRDTFKF